MLTLILIHSRESRGVRQVKFVISCKVKVLVWVNQRIDFIRFNQLSVARLAEYCLWLLQRVTFLF